MRLNSVTVDKEVDLVTPPSHESGLNCPTPPEVDLLRWHRLALCCIYLRHLLLHCTLYGVQSQLTVMLETMQVIYRPHQ